MKLNINFFLIFIFLFINCNESSLLSGKSEKLNEIKREAVSNIRKKGDLTPLAKYFVASGIGFNSDYRKKSVIVSKSEINTKLNSIKLEKMIELLENGEKLIISENTIIFESPDKVKGNNIQYLTITFEFNLSDNIWEISDIGYSGY